MRTKSFILVTVIAFLLCACSSPGQKADSFQTADLNGIWGEFVIEEYSPNTDMFYIRWDETSSRTKVFYQKTNTDGSGAETYEYVSENGTTLILLGYFPRLESITIDAMSGSFETGWHTPSLASELIKLEDIPLWKE